MLELSGLGPLLALAAVAGLVLLLRWTYSRGGSLVAGPGRPGHEGEYGLLVPVATPESADHASDLVARLERAGVRANLADTADGPRIMVFAEQLDRARSVLDDPH